MLNLDTLQALKTLKQDIRSSRNLNQGIVKATPMKFGFVTTKEGGQVFIAPPLMEQLLPGDEIEYEVVENSRGDQEAKLERLIKSEFKQFYGRVVVRGKHLFIECDDARFNRWFFVPPNKRSGLKPGALVEAKVISHPTKLEGKSQASVITKLGNEANLAELRAYTLKKMAINSDWPKGTDERIAELVSPTDDARLDMTELPFVTIDSAHARDLDDAVYCEARGDDFKLWVAIADPVSALKYDEQLLSTMIARTTSHYLPGQVVHMMPPSLSQERFSLLPELDRPALIAEFDIQSSGEISKFDLYKATINSKAKLSYIDVENLLKGDESAISSEFHEPLQRLHSAYQLLRNQRISSAVDISERPDYHIELDENQQVGDIKLVTRLDSQRLIEEFMLLTNRFCSQWLADRQCGLFNNHGGFRTERIGDLKLLLKHYWGEEAAVPNDLNSFVTLMREALYKDADIPLRSVLVRWLQPSKVAASSEGHFGLGFAHYATVTSPIRRAVDLVNHLIIDDVLSNADRAITQLATLDIDQLNNEVVKGRQASNSIEAVLKTQFANKTLTPKDTYAATITQVSQAGLAIRLDETGIEGFIELKAKRGEKSGYQFEGWRLTATFGDDFFHLDMPICVKLAKVDEEKSQVKFKLA